jgi:hypothetical protein
MASTYHAQSDENDSESDTDSDGPPPLQAQAFASPGGFGERDDSFDTFNAATVLWLDLDEDVSPVPELPLLHVAVAPPVSISTASATTALASRGLSSNFLPAALAPLIPGVVATASTSLLPRAAAANFAGTHSNAATLQYAGVQPEPPLGSDLDQRFRLLRTRVVNSRRDALQLLVDVDPSVAKTSAALLSDESAAVSAWHAQRLTVLQHRNVILQCDRTLPAATQAVADAKSHVADMALAVESLRTILPMPPTPELTSDMAIAVARLDAAKDQLKQVSSSLLKIKSQHAAATSALATAEVAWRAATARRDEHRRRLAEAGLAALRRISDPVWTASVILSRMDKLHDATQLMRAASESLATVRVHARVSEECVNRRVGRAMVIGGTALARVSTVDAIATASVADEVRTRLFDMAMAYVVLSDSTTRWAYIDAADPTAWLATTTVLPSLARVRSGADLAAVLATISPASIPSTAVPVAYDQHLHVVESNVLMCVSFVGTFPVFHAVDHNQFRHAPIVSL